MSNRLAFQAQLASIMEVLANAAVAEICKLVDDDYAVINLQMSQCQRENKALKRKLHLMELRMARGYAERRIRESAGNRSSRVQVSANLSDKYRAPVAGTYRDLSTGYSRIWARCHGVKNQSTRVGLVSSVFFPLYYSNFTTIRPTLLSKKTNKQKRRSSKQRVSCGLMVKTLLLSSSDDCHATTVGPLSKTPNPLCPRGALT